MKLKMIGHVPQRKNTCLECVCPELKRKKSIPAFIGDQKVKLLSEIKQLMVVC